MARILWACWDGGGNLTPSIGISQILEERGHDVHFYGRPEMVARVKAAGLTATPLVNARTDLDRYSFHPTATVFGYTSSQAVGEELVTLVRANDPDVVIIDAMFSTALNVAPRFNRPTVVMLHTFFNRMLGGWRANFAMQSESRQRAGFDGLPDLDTLWGQRDLLHVSAERITSAAEEILGDSRFREESERRSAAFGNLDGAQIAATSVEALLSRIS